MLIVGRYRLRFLAGISCGLWGQVVRFCPGSSERLAFAIDAGDFGGSWHRSHFAQSVLGRFLFARFLQRSRFWADSAVVFA